MTAKIFNMLCNGEVLAAKNDNFALNGLRNEIEWFSAFISPLQVTCVKMKPVTESYIWVFLEKKQIHIEIILTCLSNFKIVDYFL